MRVWRVYWQDPDLGTLVRWRSSKAHGKARLKRALDELGDRADTGPSGVELVEIPTYTKVALINWLNTNMTSDNG